MILTTVSLETTWPGRRRWRRNWRKWRQRCLSYAFCTAQLSSISAISLSAAETHFRVVKRMPAEAVGVFGLKIFTAQFCSVYWQWYAQLGVLRTLFSTAMLLICVPQFIVLWSLLSTGVHLRWKIGVNCKGGLAIALFSEEVFLLSAHVILGYWVLVVQQIVSNLRTRTSYYLRV